MKRRRAGRAVLLAIGAAGLAVSVLVLSACGGGSGSATSSSSTTVSVPGAARIPQPPVSDLNKRTRGRLAPASHRVDLTAPTFSNPTEITNRLFPISNLQSVVLVGKLHGKPWRAETNLLPGTRTVDWNGQRIKVLESQFVAYLNGRIFEVAIDRYAQADDGSVWYLGEDAFTYKGGRAVDTEGTWVAGVQGPPAMIMPANPQVGDVYRTENIPGLVFEEVTIKRTEVTVKGPTGPVHGAIIGQELHMDEKRLEEKTFAPGYGEFFSGGGSTYEATALAVPADSSSTGPPAALSKLSTGATRVLGAIGSGNWAAASAGVKGMNAAWSTQSNAGPQRLDAEMGNTLDALTQAVRARRARKGSAAAVDAAQAALDLELQYRPAAAVNVDRFALWARRLTLDARAGAQGAVDGDIATLDWIRGRLPLATSDANRIDDQLRFLDLATEARQLTPVAHAAARLEQSIATVASVTAGG